MSLWITECASIGIDFLRYFPQILAPLKLSKRQHREQRSCVQSSIGNSDMMYITATRIYITVIMGWVSKKSNCDILEWDQAYTTLAFSGNNRDLKERWTHVHNLHPSMRRGGRFGTSLLSIFHTHNLIPSSLFHSFWRLLSNSFLISSQCSRPLHSILSVSKNKVTIQPWYLRKLVFVIAWCCNSEGIFRSSSSEGSQNVRSSVMVLLANPNWKADTQFYRVWENSSL